MRFFNKQRVRAGFQLQSPTGELIHKYFSFGFVAPNNEAEYESLIAGLRLKKAFKSKQLRSYGDSQIITSKFNGDYEARKKRMDIYLKIIQDLVKDFKFFELTKVPQGENVCIDAAAASSEIRLNGLSLSTKSCLLTPRQPTWS